MMLALATILGGVMLFSNPVAALSWFCVGLFCYPQQVVLNFGAADFSLARVLIIPLLAIQILRQGLWRTFRWNRIDTLVVVTFVCQSLALLANERLMKIAERQSGNCFDTVLVYFAVRLAIRSLPDALQFVKHLMMMGSVLAVLGVVHAVTHRNPTAFLYGPFWTGDPPYMMRHGFQRADVTFGSSIGLGMFLAALAPLSISLRAPARLPRSTPYLFLSFMILGTAASMSSGPLFTIVVSLSLMAFYPLRNHWRFFLFVFIAMCFFLEIYSNSHFYYILTRFAFSTENAYYRIGVYEEAFGGGMTGHWLFGYGLIGFDQYRNPIGFNWEHYDITSLFIGILIKHGLLGTVPFLALTILYFRRLACAFRLAASSPTRWFVWCLSSTMIGWSVGTLTVAPIGSLLPFFFILIALSGIAPALVAAAGPTFSYARIPEEDSAKGRVLFVA
ncbi:MAG: hypothetical protein NTW86_14630 [Candidatus Sumerlaeota bacterium]|nr:hypothetical protein [Candidatus Sumerlaeota bacterium]